MPSDSSVGTPEPGDDFEDGLESAAGDGGVVRVLDEQSGRGKSEIKPVCFKRSPSRGHPGPTRHVALGSRSPPLTFLLDDHGSIPDQLINSAILQRLQLPACVDLSNHKAN